MSTENSNTTQTCTIDSVMPRFYTYWYSHNTYQEGGRKTHLTDENYKVLCGLDQSIRLGNTNEIDGENIILGVKTGELCKKCARAALKLIKTALNEA